MLVFLALSLPHLCRTVWSALGWSVLLVDHSVRLSVYGCVSVCVCDCCGYIVVEKSSVLHTAADSSTQWLYVAIMLSMCLCVSAHIAVWLANCM